MLDLLAGEVESEGEWMAGCVLMPEPQAAPQIRIERAPAARVGAVITRFVADRA